MKKYETLLLQQIDITLDKWRKQEHIAHEELYRLLHSIQGTAATIGRKDWGDAASALLLTLPEEEGRLWNAQDWEILLTPLLELMLAEKQTRYKVILLVEPESGTLAVLKTILESQDWIVLAANSSGRAITLFQSMKPDCILIDLKAAREIGQEQRAYLQAEAERRLIPILVMYEPDEVSSVVPIFQQGGDDVFVKPLDREELIARMQRHLTRRASVLDRLTLDAGTEALVSEAQEEGTHPIRIAIIDDDELIRGMLEKQLADIGGDRVEVEIRSFTDGEHFFQDDWHLQQGPFVVILDRMMPKMNGMEVLQRLRAGYDRSKYSIIMLTAVSNEDEIAQSLEAGCDDYMTKPFSLVELEARIRRLMKGAEE